jgi:hypothetical protein
MTTLENQRRYVMWLKSLDNGNVIPYTQEEQEQWSQSIKIAEQDLEDMESAASHPRGCVCHFCLQFRVQH